jgi:hypothetical protein
MHRAQCSADDPRLTAYALGELDPADVPALEAALREDAALRLEVERIRSFAAKMEAALAAEPHPAAASPVRSAPPRRPERPRSRWLAFPQLYYVCGGLAAAALAMFVAVNREELLARQRRQAEQRPSAPAVHASSPSLIAIDLVTDPPDGSPPTTAGASSGNHGYVLAPNPGEAAFAALRQHLAARRLPPGEAVLPGELINALRYRRPLPSAPAAPPIAAELEVGAAPWAPERQLVRIGLHGRDADLAATRQTILDRIEHAQASIARNVRIQVEFNPARVSTYRLVGANREVAAQTAPIDELAAAPAMFAGQAFTALYEILPVAPARETAPRSAVLPVSPTELITVRLQYAEPAGGTARTLEFSLADRRPAAMAESEDFRLAAAAAEFALVLRQPQSPGTGPALRAVLERVAAAVVSSGEDPDGRRAEFREFVRQAQSLLE